MLVFAVIGLVGFFFLIVSALFGGDAGHDMDHGVDHDHGGAPSWFSTRVIAMFLTGFGATGAIARSYELSYPLSAALGLVTGLVVGAAGFQLIHFFMRQQASSTVQEDDMVGQLGSVTVAIPPNGIGQVVLEVKGRRVFPSARATTAAAIDEGVQVKVVRSSGSQVVVERA
jgi:membrane protein implicated in regulation of membrane protease activity